MSAQAQQSEPRDGAKQKAVPSNQQHATQDSPKPPAAPTASNSGSVSQPTAGDRKSQTRANPDGWEKAFAPETWSQWAIVILTAIGFYFAIRSLKAVEIQAKTGQDSADAAQLSAEALISIERPWIVVRAKDPPGLPAPEAPRNGPPMTFDVEIRNQGRTPAKVVAVWFRFHTFTEDLPDIPVYHGQEDTPDIGRVVIPNGDPWRLKGPFEGNRLTIEQVADIRAKRLCWTFYGLVKYFDFANRSHECQFGYVYYVPTGQEPVPVQEGWIIGGYAEYNKNT